MRSVSKADIDEQIALRGARQVIMFAQNWGRMKNE